MAFNFLLFLLILRVLQDIQTHPAGCFQLFWNVGSERLWLLWIWLSTQMLKKIVLSQHRGWHIYCCRLGRGVNLTGCQHTKTICYISCPGCSGSMATACPKGRVVHQAERWRVQFPLLQLPEGCTHGFAVGEPLSSLIRVRGPKKTAQGSGAMNTLWALGSPKGAVSCAVGDRVPWGPFGWTTYLTSWLARLSSQWGCVMCCWWSSSVRSPWVDSIPNKLMGLAQFLTHKRDWKDRAQ